MFYLQDICRQQTLHTQKFQRPSETMFRFTPLNVFVAVLLLLVTLPLLASAQNNCGPQFDNKICPGTYCCNPTSGWCGSTPEHCNPPTCDTNYGKCGAAFSGPSNAPDSGQCGPGHGNCTGNMCCSRNNYCGSDEEYCSLTLGCRPAYGKCGLPKGGLSTGDKVGIAVGTFAFIAAVMAALWVYFKRKPAKRYTYNQLLNATDGFSEANKLGDGTYGEVYRGAIHGKSVAVKKLKKMGLNSKTGSSAQIKAFEAEIQTRTQRLNHKNLMEVIGFYAKNNDRFLVYEYMHDGSLSDWLFPPSELEQGEEAQFLHWAQRFNIVKGVAEGLIYLHHSLGGNIKSIVHGDIKPDNILLGKGLVPKLTDFGMAKLIMTSETYAMEAGDTAVLLGTEGYRAPEASTSNILHHKADVFSFGIVLLEIVSGRRVFGKLEGNKKYYLPLLAVKYFLSQPQDLSIVLDPKLDLRQRERDEAKRVLRAALWCLQYVPQDRPNMNVVLDLLKGNTIDESNYQNPPTDLLRLRDIFEDQERDLFGDPEAQYRITHSSATAISDASHNSNSQIQPLNLSNSRTEVQLHGNQDDAIQIGESSNSAASASLLSHSQPLSDPTSEYSPLGQKQKGVNHPD